MAVHTPRTTVCAGPGFYLANTVRIVETLVELKRMDDAKVRMAAVLRAPRSEEDPSTLTARITELRAKLSM